MEDIEIFQNTSISKESYDNVISRLPEFHRVSSIIGHSTSQTSYSLQTMNMVSDSPMSRMKQCQAQIGKRFNALREAHFKVEKMKLEIIDLGKNNDRYSQLDILDKSSTIQEIIKTMNQSFREIGMFQDMYDSIMKNNNIPANWTEKDFEYQEMENMIKASYRLAIQDITHSGRCGQAVVEYWEQLGIHPQVGEIETRLYMSSIQEALEKGDIITIQHMYFFLDAMVTKHKDDWKFVLVRIGLDTIGSERYMAENVRDINK
jgi:hypothetical protein